MGFSFRGKASDRPPLSDGDVSPIEAVSVNPEADLKRFKTLHKWDPFMEIDKLDAADDVLRTGDLEKEAIVEASLLEDDSPYAEVRAAVKPTDDPEMPCSTVRAWCIGFITCTVVTACNVLLALRRSPVTITPTVVQLIAYPMGKGWHAYMPNWKFRMFGREVQVNPESPFNTKEHTVIVIMTAAGSALSYALDILLAQEIFYQQHFGWGFQILLILSTQAMGFGLAGVMRRFLVWPAAMVWPATLIFATVMNTLHDHSPTDPSRTNGWRIGRYKFFLIVSACTFCYEWIPQVIAQFLQLFLFACWIAPNNVLVNQLLGGQTGVGLIPVSFDWSVISGFLSSPLQTPAFAHFNVGLGILVMMLGSVCLAYAGPEFYRYLPISENASYDNTGHAYNVSRILNPDFTFNQTAYEEYSPLMLGASFSLTYGMSFAALVSTVVHVALFYGKDIWARARRATSEEADIHLKLMRKYREVPELWFASVFLVSFAFGMIACQVWETHLAWWAYIICVLIGVFFILPVGVIQAITNQQTGLNVITELIIGYMQPGRPLAMMLFKSWGYMSSNVAFPVTVLTGAVAFNGLNYVSDMKIGFYLKIPPRTMFLAQFFAVTWLSIVQIATYNFLRGNIEGICTSEQAEGLTCPGAKTFFNASIIWGVVGPKRMFSPGSLYSWVNWFWLIGAVLVVIQYVVARRYPRGPLRYVFFPAVFGAAGQIPPATCWYLGQWVIVGLIFNYVIRRRFFGWWSRYNYVLSGALDIGTALCIVVVALALGLSGAQFPSWWGNDVPFNNLDANGAAVTKTLPDDGSFFGPRTWS